MTNNDNNDALLGGSNETEEVAELTPGHSDDKYEVAEVEVLEDGLSYKLTLTIFDLEDQDHDDSYYLEVENSLGMETYYFSIDIDGNYL